MHSLSIEVQKLRRAGVIGTLMLAGAAGSIYAVMNWVGRKEVLLAADINPMSVLLTQLYGVICLLNIFAIIVITSNIYYIEHQNNGLKRMRTLPIKISEIFTSKLVILSGTLLIAYVIEFTTLALLGNLYLPKETFDFIVLIQFAFYVFLISLPCLTLMLMVSMLSANLWITIGIGVVGFFSGMSMVAMDTAVNTLNPFALILKPAMSLSAEVDLIMLMISVIETIIFVAIGIFIANKRKEE